MVLDERGLLLRPLHEFLLFFTILLFAFFMKSLNSLLGDFRLFMVERNLNFFLPCLNLSDLPGAGNDHVFLVGGNVVFLRFVVECKVVLFAINW